LTRGVRRRLRAEHRNAGQKYVNQAERAARKRDESVAVREREQREEEDDTEAGQTASLIGLENFP
jgi:hypothetical protein